MGGDRLVAEVAGDQAEQRHGDSVRDAWVEEFDTLLPEVRPVPGAKDFLQFVRGQGLTVVLATSGKPEHVDHYLDLLDGRELADSWVTAEDAEQSKPAPDLVSVALQQARATSSVMVGDSTWDVHAASNVGVPAVCVRTGGFGEAELRNAGAIAVVDDLPTLQQDWQLITAR
jgi:HAD superfamily hydrolase (TIGR01549 family)